MKGDLKMIFYTVKVNTLIKGNIYEGSFKDNEFHGKGVYDYRSSGNRYIGTWSKGLENGFGVFTWADGDKYETGMMS